MNLTSIPLTNGIPSGGTGNVSTIDQMLTVLPPALGLSSIANSMSVVQASNQATQVVTLDTTVMGVGLSGNTSTPVKSKIVMANGGIQTIVALTAAKKTRLLAAYLVANGAVTVNFQSHTTTGTADGPMSISNTGGMVLPFNPVGWLDTVAGEALDLNASNANSIGGLVVTITL